MTDVAGTQAARAVLRSADRHVVERVRRLCALAGLELVLTAPGSEPPSGAVLLDDRSDPLGAPWRTTAPDGSAVVELAPPGTSVDGALQLPADTETLLALLASAATPVRARVVGVIGAAGGLGVSALAAVLARLSVVAGSTTALVDLDPAGGGLDVLLGVEHDAGPRWADLLGERGGFPPERLMASLPSWHGVRVLSADVRGGAAAGHPVALDAANALARAADAVVLDLPRSLLAPAGEPTCLTLCDDVVLLAGCDVRSAAGAAAAVSALGPARAHLVVRGPSAGTLLAEDIADACGVPLVAVLRPERAFAAGLERGLSPGDQRRGPLLTTGRRVLRTVGLAA